MGLFSRGDRLKEHKQEKERVIRPYKPPRPLSWLGCGLIIVVGLAMLLYAGSLFLMRFGGTEVDAATNTRLDENGAVVEVPVTGITATMRYTYRDADGKLHAGTGSLSGNTEPFEDTIPVVYFAPVPGWSMLAFRTEDILTPFGGLLLGVIMLYVGFSRLREIRSKKEEAPPEEPAE